MMHKMICIVCPRGCHLEVNDDNKVSGNFCPRGAIYAIKELSHPERMITSTVKVVKGDLKRLSVATNKPIPKEKIFDVMEEIKKVEVVGPLPINSIVIQNVLNLNVDIISTRDLKEK